VTTTFTIAGAHVLTVDGAEREFVNGYVAVDGNRIVGVGAGEPPQLFASYPRVDGRDCLLTPGFVNTHHHLYQWSTRGIATESTLFEWLVKLYPIWANIDSEITYASARGGLASLLLSGCTYASDHHYLFPREGGDCFSAEVEAAKSVGIRFHPSRGSMDLGRSRGGLPPDNVVEERDEILRATEEAIWKFHDPASDAMVKVAVAPCSPFSVSGELMREAAALARHHKVRLHTHLAETIDEDEFCRVQFGCNPTEYVESLGWLGNDVWMAHAIHLDDAAITKFGITGTGVAHCPSSNARLGSGIARVNDLLAAGAPVGLGVDGAASNENGELLTEVRAATLWARLRGGPAAMSSRQALTLATMGGAKVLGRANDLGSIEVGKLADLALWRLSDIGHIDVVDPVAALVLGPRATLKMLLVNGVPVVENGALIKAQETEIAQDARAANRKLMARAGR
jgi:cytosine/adenosine deaminase-related metal-dependent hydrolase